MEVNLFVKGPRNIYPELSVEATYMINWQNFMELQMASYFVRKILHNISHFCEILSYCILYN